MNPTGDGPTHPAVLEVVVAIPFDLYLQEDCLGDVFDIKIGQIVVDLWLPGLAVDSNSGIRIVAPDFRSQPRGVDWQRTLNDLEPWGRLHRPSEMEVAMKGEGSRHPRPYPILIRHVLLKANLGTGDTESVSELAEATANQIAADVEQTLEILREWAEVATYDSASPGFREISKLPPDGLKFWLFDGIKRCTVTHIRNFLVARSDSYTGLDRETWLHILQCVSANIRPPVEYSFLKEAFASLLRQDTRKAVLDSATAAEVALSKTLDDKLAGLPLSVIDIVTSSAQGLSRLVSTLQNRFDVHLPAGINQRLGQPRNQTIHTGETPSFQAAMEALHVAIEIVEMAHPRSDLFVAARSSVTEEPRSS